MTKNNRDLSFPDLGLYFLAFGLGLSLLKVEIALLLCIGLIFGKRYIVQASSQVKHGGFWLAVVLIGLFLFLYASQYLPYPPNPSLIGPNYFKVLLFWVFCVIFLPLCSSSPRVAFTVIWLMSLGASFFAFATTVASVWLLPPPLYGGVVDLRGLARGLIQIQNSPGIANLLCAAPMVFSAGWLLKPNERPSGFLWTGVWVTAIAIFAAFLLQQRTFFLLIFVLQPILIGFLEIFLGRYRLGVGLLSLVLIYPLLAYLDLRYGMQILPRKLDAALLSDARFLILDDWWSHLLDDPWRRGVVGPAPYEWLFWFHNFFADVHRLSGLWALLAAGLLCGVVFLRIGQLALRRPDQGAFLLGVAVPTFAIMNTSVVPEGEVQPFLMLLLVYATCERFLPSRSGGGSKSVNKYGKKLIKEPMTRRWE